MKAYPGMAAFLVAAAVAGCDSAKLFEAHPAPETPGGGELAWPRLVDTPAAPPQGQYTADVPDPAQGTAAEVEMRLLAREAGARAEALSAPVLTEQERRRLTGRR